MASSKRAENYSLSVNLAEDAQPLHRFQAPRLTRLQESSSNIQYDFLPQSSRSSQTYTPDPPGKSDGEDPTDSSQLLTDIWPRLENTNDESENDPQANQVDPLLTRHLPENDETVDIEELPIALPHRRNIPTSMRIIFIVLTILAILALIVDSILLSIDLTHRANSKAHNTVPPLPTLTLTRNTVQPGQTVLLQLAHFRPSTQVLLTHDIHEAVRTDIASPLIKMGSNGNADVHMLIEDSWKPGFHIIEGEDVTTHYTASATLQVIGAGPMLSPHLVINHLSLNMGKGPQFENTIQSLTLRNSGGGSILWTASSDQPWLMFTPTQGIFSDSQSIYVAVARTNLQPGNYTGTITIVSNAGAPAHIQVNMTVLPLPANSGAVLAVAPPVLSFTAADGGNDPAGQLLIVSNPGSQILNWSLALSSLSGDGSQNLPFLSNTDWLSIDYTSGTVAPGSKTSIHAIAHSHNLLPGVYSALLTFTPKREGLNNPQTVVVSLTIQPGCGVTTSMGNMSFTAISGQRTPVNEALSLDASAGCTDVLSWQAFPSASWLNITPSHGQLQGNGSAVATIGVNAGALSPGTYNGLVVFMAGQSTQTVMVLVTVLQASPSPTSGAQPTTPIVGGSGGSGTPQPTPSSGSGTPRPGTPPPGTPPPGTPAMMSVSPLDLNFSTTQGQANPGGQQVKISNTGGNSLNWQANVNSSSASWLGIKPVKGSVAAGRSVQMTVNVDATGLPPGTYSTQVSVTATDASGAQVQNSPQIISVTLTISQPCSLEVTPSSLSFTASLLQPNPAGQSIQLKEVGNCTYPISWTASADKSWIVLSRTSGSDAGSGSTIVVQVNTSGMLIGHYTGQITVSAIANGGGKVQSSPQTISVTLTVIG